LRDFPCCDFSSEVNAKSVLEICGLVGFLSARVNEKGSVYEGVVCAMP